MIDEMQDPLRQGSTLRFNPDHSVTVMRGRVRCCRCDALPQFLFGSNGAPICQPCQVALYQVAYAAFMASRETPTYVEKPKWWATIRWMKVAEASLWQIVGGLWFIIIYL